MALYPFLSALLFQLLILCMACHAVAAGELPDCHTMELFRSQTVSPGVAMADTGENLGITCRLRFGAAATVLLGSPDGRLLSPLRHSLPAVVLNAKDDKDTAMNDLDYYSVFSYARQFWKRLCAYPWSEAAAVERFFFRRQFRLRFAMDTGAEGEVMDSNQLLGISMLGRIRATSFSPIIVHGEKMTDGVGDNARLTCDRFEEAVEMHRVHGEISSMMGRITGALGMRVLSFFSGGVRAGGGGATLSKTPMPMKNAEVYLFEELGPYRGGSLWMPSWVSAWFGSRPMATTEVVHRRGASAASAAAAAAAAVGGSSGGDSSVVGRYDQFIYEAHVPVVKPVCLRLAAVQEPGLVVQVEESVAFDMFWLKIVLSLFLVRFVRSWVEDIPALQILVAGLGSIVVLGGFILLFLIRKLQSMTLGKIGMFAILTMGGVSALAESLLSATTALLYTYFRFDDQTDFFFHLTWVLLLAGLFFGLLARSLWANYLGIVTRWTLWWLQLCVLSCAALQNREATFIVSTAASVLRPSLIFRLIMWCSPSHRLENRENDPEECFSPAARRPVEYVPPLCVEGRLGGSRELSPGERLHLYEVLGNEYTQRALAHLAKRVKDEPERYASRLRDPNSVVSWAQQQNQALHPHFKRASDSPQPYAARK